MNNALTILDDFLPDAALVRAFALEHDFTQAPEFDGNRYPGFAPVKDARFLEWVAERIAAAIGCNVGIQMAAFVAGTQHWSTQQWIHADSSCASHAGVLYLFDRAGFGTAFWRHHDHGEALGRVSDVQTAESVAAQLRNDGQSEEAWTRTDYAESRFNRFIFYPSQRFHSRYPQQAFGDRPDNCRLTLAVFFDILP